MKDPRRLRTKAVWLLVVPFFVFAAPTAQLLAVGGGLALLGLGIRAWAAGTIQKDRELTTTGPYAFTRNPLYIGSFFIGLGVTVAGGGWLWPLLFLLFYGVVYSRTLAYEAEVLGELFGDGFRAYAAEVPSVFPRLTPFEGGGEGGFRMAHYMRNKEWEAALGVLAAFLILGAKTLL